MMKALIIAAAALVAAGSLEYFDIDKSWLCTISITIMLISCLIIGEVAGKNE